MLNRKKELNKMLLSEELKKHMQLVEYTFYVGEDADIAGDPEKKDLILGEDPEDENPENQTPEPENPENQTPEPENSDELNTDSNPEPEEDNFDQLDQNGEDMGAESGMNQMPDMGAEPGMNQMPDMGAEPGMNQMPDMGMEDEVELDVTELVQSTEDAKASSEMANQKMVELIQQFNALNSKLNKLEDLDSKIAKLEDEVIKRNPTEVEQLEMRSFDSFPYNLKLTDYWSDKENEGNIQATNNPINQEPEEYELTLDDVNSTYNQHSIQKSFDDIDDELDKFTYLK